ncbi:pilus assembly protein [Boseaceae bacterium BT-24-1]|nr:pilus assembly protein [Boseaceae bacterium BT-24-1]
MKAFPKLLRRTRPRGIASDERGVAAIEFALVSTMMFMLLSGAVDVIQMVTVHRDLHRITAEAALVLTACPDTSCRAATAQSLYDRRANISPQLADIQIGAASFTRIDDKIDNMVGTMTYLPADMNTDALGMLANNDSGVAVLASYTHKPIILGFAQKWGFSTRDFRAYTVNLRGRQK